MTSSSSDLLRKIASIVYSDTVDVQTCLRKSQKLLNKSIPSYFKVLLLCVYSNCH